eukprot:TRINITY_DN4643_c0_g1_i2.p1 TRINITY_DN4643_c0_g1~~TRINITY_DN4643_c0_g1_i2.p1  ORF type:complete len:175 (+),score=35.58 TRINITY_DN4643_c0_g1_i2:421-945(+)
MDLTVIPWGNAYCETDMCPSKTPGVYSKDVRVCWNAKCVNSTAPAECWDLDNLVCQHGDNECTGNRYEGCAISLYPDSHQWEPFLYCFEGLNGGDLTSAQKCASYAGLSWSTISSCAATQRGVDVDVANAQATNAQGPHEGVPFCLVNGVQFTGHSLLRTVCDAYTGTLPSGCP